jgi:uncharacterized protein
MSATMARALRFFDAVEGSGDEDIADVLHDEIEVHDFDLPDAGVYHGHEGVARWLADWGAPWEQWSATVHDLFDLGPQVAALTHLVARTSSGITVDREDSQLCTIHDGMIVKLEYFGDSQSAIEQADDAARARTRKQAHDKIRALYRAAAREDVDSVVALLHADYEFYPEAGAPMGAAYRGHDGARRYFSEAFEAWEILAFEVERIVDAGEDAVALFEMRNRGRGSGIELTGRWAEVWELSATDVVRSRFYQSHDEALAAAGLA